jgi:hypothetical protein
MADREEVHGNTVGDWFGAAVLASQHTAEDA